MKLNICAKVIYGARQSSAAKSENSSKRAAPSILRNGHPMDQNWPSALRAAITASLRSTIHDRIICAFWHRLLTAISRRAGRRTANASPSFACRISVTPSRWIVSVCSHGPFGLLTRAAAAGKKSGTRATLTTILSSAALAATMFGNGSLAIGCCLCRSATDGPTFIQSHPRAAR